MIPPHSGQGGGPTPVWLSGPSEAGSCFACAVGSTSSQERATEGQPFRSMAIGEESEVSNAMEAVGQGVEQEAPDELVGLQTHGLTAPRRDSPSR